MSESESLPPEERPNLRALFEAGSVSLRSAKFKRAAAALSWRQKYLNSEVYPLEMDESHIMRLRQVKNGEESGVGTGCSVWPAAHVLSKYLQKKYGHAGLVGKRVCDIGSGTGCTGIAAACLGATTTLTDQLCVFPLLESNVSAAIIDCRISREKLSVAEYNWGDDVTHLGAPFDVVLVSDCVLPKLYPIEPLVQAVSAVMGPDSVALFSYEHRPFPLYDPRQEFRRLALKYSLHVRSVPLSEHDDMFSMDDIEIWEVRRLDGAAGRDSQWKRLLREGRALKMLSWGDDKPSVMASLFDEVSLSLSQTTTGTIGCVLWPSSVVLSRYLLKNRLALNSGPDAQLALDIGAGCGLTSIALSLCGYSTIAIDKTDVTPLLLDNITRSRRQLMACLGAASEDSSVLSGIHMSHIEVMDLDWYAPTAAADILIKLNGRVPSLVVCSDCVYQSTTVAPLINLLNQITGACSELMISNELRSSFDEFLMALAGQWKFEEIALTSEDTEVYASSAETVGDPSFARFERPVRLLSGCVVSS